ncbi:uncharacterized protein LOC119173826 isoform X1 [Rhipicephalus microplus]|uniref:uncharacterized protein LOC119173826 isoform X1 n=1 Tax=Rhipicephalus microplus TaxID=6941 RepID=UPI003F6B918E
MDEAPLSGASFPSSLSCESGAAWAPCESRHSLRQHRAAPESPSGEDRGGERRFHRDTNGVVGPSRSGTSQALDCDESTIECSSEWQPQSDQFYQVYSESTPSIFLRNSLRSVGGSHSSSHNIGRSVRSSLRSNSAICDRKVSASTLLGSANETRSETDKWRLQPRPDGLPGVISDVRANWSEWFHASYLWYAMMALMAAVLLTAVAAVFLDLHLAAELTGEEQFTVADWHESHHATESRIVSPTGSFAASHDVKISTGRPRKGHRAMNVANKHGGGMSVIDGAEASGLGQPVVAVGSGTNATANEYDDDEIEKVLPPIRERSTNRCGDALYAFCGVLYHWYHYRASTDQCVFTVTEPVRVCNHSPHRFATMDECRRLCVVEGIYDFVEERPETCSGGPLFAPCTWLDVKPTWAIFNGEKCVRWPFPDGLCPARNNSAVFKSRRECANRCLSAVEEKDASTPGDPCPVGPGPAEVCRPEVLRFPYFSHHSANECFQASEEFLRNRRCLTTPTIFPDKEKCRQQCMGKTRRRR